MLRESLSESSRQTHLEEVCLQITNSCPLNCKHCSTFGGAPLPNELSLTRLKTVISELARIGARVLQLSGGEPLDSPHLEDLVSWGKEMGMKVAMYTAGNLRSNHFETIAVPFEKMRRLRSIGLDRIIFSILGDSAEMHDGITRVGGSFENILESAENARRASLNAEVHFVPMRANISGLPGLIDICKEKGIRKISILRFVPQGRGASYRAELTPRDSDIEILAGSVAEILERKPSVDIRIGAPLARHGAMRWLPSDSKCKAGTATLVIRPDGRVLPCSAFHQSERFTVGSAAEENL
ncbi:MAG: radical SAM protein, partial [Candidatus Geothermarchaeales archaeon]